ncbi:MAG: hypothetical protein IJX07_01800 [Bacillales bacterium]|nr:hypothetical protein [Bacillales bacterium]
MKKIVIILFFLSVVATGGILYFQWNEKSVSAVGEYTSSTKLTYQGNDLYVEQQFSNIKEEKIVLEIPQNVTNISGTYKSGKEMSFVNATQLLTIQPEESDFTLSYTYPHYQSGTHHLLASPFFSINKNVDGKMSLSIYDHTQNFSWVFDGKLLGTTSRDQFGLTVFWNGNPNNDLYFTTSTLTRAYQKENVDVLVSEGIKNYRFSTMIQKLEEFDLLTEPTVIIIEDGLKKPQYGDQTLVISNEVNSAKMEASIVKNLLQKRYKFASKTKAEILDLLTAFIIGTEPSNQKLAMMYNYLNQNLMIEDIKQWGRSVLADPNQAITPNLLDKMYRQLQGKNTQYFTMNLTKSSYVPFFESLDLHLTYRKEELPFTGIIYNQRVYYPMDLFTSLGFTVKEENSKFVTLTFDNNVWELRTDRNVFQYNNDYLEISRSPIARIAGDFYIEAYWLSELFPIRIVEVENQGEIIFNS